MKIAAIERRSKFLQPCDNGDYLGIEVGADAASAMSLDDLMIFDHSRNRSVGFFEQLFHNHASAVLPPSSLSPSIFASRWQPVI